ncbi:MAG: YdbL family protein [Candidatus Omnitrophica bacterium]|nr:YdbL family protein [Candidatus Omnitrophota bacterium]
MNKLKIFTILILFFMVGCATVRVKAPEKPIKLDVTMRLDVYQHVQNDIDAIENIVTGSDEKKQPKGTISLLDRLVSTAYAEELDSEVENAALRRKARYSQLVSLEQSGVIGESNSGMVVVRKSAGASTEKLVRDENNDRMIIYGGIAAKNNTSVNDVQKVYAARLQQDAPSGTPIEAKNGSWQIR